MDYTINKLVKLSGLSIRTLHYYDEIGLLVPSIRMTNGRRYYGKKELMRLMQILQLKNLRLSLENIQSILDGSPEDNISALALQKEILSKEINYLKYSSYMIDELILYYKGEYNMDISEKSIEQSFEGFKYRKDYAKYFDEESLKKRRDDYKHLWSTQVGEESFAAFEKTMNNITVDTAKEFGRNSGKLMNEIFQAYENGLEDTSKEVQELMNRHFALNKPFMPDATSKDSYLCLRDQLTRLKSYRTEEDENFKKYFEFLHDAMSIFAEQNFPT